MGVDDIDGVDLMPLETPVLKVSRPVAACSRCRNAKIKCDGKLPACTSCEKSGRASECTSTNDQFARGKERSYVSTLETRIDRLQAKLEDARRRKPSVVSIPDDETATAVPSRRASWEPDSDITDRPSTPTPLASKADRRREASAIDDLVSGFGFLSVNATARDFYGFTSAMSYARLILSACSKDPLPQGTTKALPPRHLATQLVQHYLNNVFQLIPVFDEASFYASVDSVYHRDWDKAEPIDHWMVRLVLAVACASMSERSGDQYHLEGIGHACAALEHSEEVLHPGAISSVQALVLLVEYAMLDPHHFDSWSLIGVASRAMVDLGLHQDPPKGAAMSKGRLELRRRVFWCVYALDRSTSLVQTRAFSFSDNSANVKIPFGRQPSSTTPPENQEASARSWLQSHQQALDLIAMRQIQSKWYTDLFQSGRTVWEEPYPYIWQVCDEMRRWFENVSKTTTMNMRAFFELDLLYSYIYILSPSPRVPAVSRFAQTLVFEYCIRYADLVLRLISTPEYTAPMTFYDAMRVYMTGRQFLDVLQQNTDGLLNGIVPPRPEVRPSTAPPPSLPQVMLPPGDTVQRFNTARSITCIKQITDCLARFGTRWGYMSWNQRYQTETEPMLNDLTGRLRELEVMAGTRRPSMWQHSNSTGSVGSNGSSTQYGSPPGSVQGQQMYPQAPMQAHPPQLARGNSDNAPGRRQSVAPFQQHQQQQPVQPPQQQAYQQPMATFPTNYPQQASHSQQPTFNFNDPSSNFSSQQYNVNPHSQFGSWGGYSGPSMPDTLDEENAIPPLTPNSNAFLDSLLAQQLQYEFNNGIDNEHLPDAPTAASASAGPSTAGVSAATRNQQHQAQSSQHEFQFVQDDGSRNLHWRQSEGGRAPGHPTVLPAQNSQSGAYGKLKAAKADRPAQSQPELKTATNRSKGKDKGKTKAAQLNPGDPGFVSENPGNPGFIPEPDLWQIAQKPAPGAPTFRFDASQRLSANENQPSTQPERSPTPEDTIGDAIYQAYVDTHPSPIPRRTPSPLPPLACAYPGLRAPVVPTAVSGPPPPDQMQQQAPESLRAKQAQQPQQSAQAGSQTLLQQAQHRAQQLQVRPRLQQQVSQIQEAQRVQQGQQVQQAQLPLHTQLQPVKQQAQQQSPQQAQHQPHLLPQTPYAQRLQQLQQPRLQPRSSPPQQPGGPRIPPPLPATRLPAPPTTTPSGYRFTPNHGFTCLVCDTVVSEPGVHIAHNGAFVQGPWGEVQEWCTAFGPQAARDAEVLKEGRAARVGRERGRGRAGGRRVG